MKYKTGLDKLVLVLNADYTPLTFQSLRRALILVLKGKAKVLEVSPAKLHTNRIDLPIPSVVKLEEYVRVPHINRAVSRKHILLRDNSTCQYCGKHLPGNELTLDHVIPRSRGGKNNWENLTTACFSCNNRKRDCTPEEAGMVLLRRPHRLTVHAKHKLLAGDEKAFAKYMFV